jgi:hypothetical protein
LGTPRKIRHEGGRPSIKAKFGLEYQYKFLRIANAKMTLSVLSSWWVGESLE